MDYYYSIPAEIMTVGGQGISEFDSLSLDMMCIGKNEFFESAAIEASATVLYAWGRDYNAGRVSSNISEAVCVKLVEL